jgi:TPR repeat protein
MYKNKKILIAALIALYCYHANADSIKDIQATCSDIGFKKETKAYDDCVIELILREKNKEQELVHKNNPPKALLEEEQKKIIDNIMFPPSETIDDRVKLEKDAEEGNTFSEYQLGYINYIGKNVPKNNEKAFFWIQKAATKGLTEAEYYLGIMYFYGEGTQKDNKKSLYWIQRSAQKGYFEAQYYLGNMYYTGDGVPKDYNKAVLWLEKSVDSFDEFDKAPFVLSEIYLSDDYKHKNIHKALKWLHKAAELGNAEAQFKLGVMYDLGENITQDFSKAFEWYKKSATLIESEGTTYNIAKMYYFGRGVPKDPTIAATWYLKSAMLGNAMAQFNLSLMYHNGDGLIKNRVKAYAWMNLAAAQSFGNSQAARDDFEKELTQEELIEAQKMASNWKKGSDLSVSNDAVIAVEKTNTPLKKEDIKNNKYFNYSIIGIVLSIFIFILFFYNKRKYKSQLNNISYSNKKKTISAYKKFSL